MKKFTLTALAVLIAVGSTISVQAQFFNNSAGITNPAVTITFDEHSLSQNTPMTTQYQDVGILFETGTMFYNPDPGNNNGGHINPPSVGNFMQNVTAHNPFSISFVEPQTAAAFALSGRVGTVTLTAYLNNVVIATGSASTGPAGTLTNDFYGFSGITFDQVRFSESSIDNALVIDNIQLSVPEPTTTSSLIAGAALLGGSLYLRRRRACC